jgi:AraC-like DNA-binding protein
MRGSHIYRDPELSLNRLAGKVGISARAISGAVNRARGANVSQYVNEHRVRDACRRLSQTDWSLKSYSRPVPNEINFQLRAPRITGMSPSAWRACRAKPTSGTCLLVTMLRGSRILGLTLARAANASIVTMGLRSVAAIAHRTPAAIETTAVVDE